MKYIQVKVIEDGFQLDPGEYLKILPDIEDELPEGARRFANDGEHYDFYSLRCVKDLTLDHVTSRDVNGGVSLSVGFAPNRFKHDAGLVIRYTEVTSFSIETAPAAIGRANSWHSRTHRLGALQLDEVLPHECGCSHEIRLASGTIQVVCSDFVAEWHTVIGGVDGLGMDGEHVE